MPLIIPNTSLADDYTDATTFAGSDVFQAGYFTVANNPAAVQLGVGPAGLAVWQPEQYLPPATYPIIPGGASRPVSGLRAKNFIAGSVAQLFGGLTYPGEPSVQAGTPYTQLVTPSGSVSPPGTVSVIASDATVVTVQTNVEQILSSFTVPGGTMLAKGIVRVTFYGEFQSGNNGNCILRTYYGGTLLDACWMPGGASRTGFRAAYITTIVWNNGVTNAQLCNFDGFTGYDAFQSSGQVPVIGAIDSTADQVLQVTAQWQVNAASNTLLKRRMIAEAFGVA